MSTGVRNVTPVMAASLAWHGEAILVDVRTKEEWEVGHATQAIHIPLDSLSPARIPEDQVVLLVCRSGQRSTQAAAILEATHQVANVTGGMLAWATAGLPVLTDAGTAGEIA